jgi:hypothetical protein
MPLRFRRKRNWREKHSKEMGDSKRIYEEISREIPKEISEKKVLLKILHKMWVYPEVSFTTYQ